VLACALAGIRVRVACPSGHSLDPLVVDAARARGGEVLETTRPDDAVAGADAVATDVWVSMGQEGEQRERVDAFASYRVDEAMMARAADGAVFLHCLPAHRGLEVTAAVIDGPVSAVWQQAANRMHAVRGLLLWLLGPRP
ncbi:MAG TPA: ornithine carbamoyltransferase, partial [Acidimicrobiales bacterium]|nr:ornithine carbamoyltransferase [Acidimicrobiales bacterium]